MAGWIAQAARRGILTTRYPAEPPQEEEDPGMGRPPQVPPGAGPILGAAGTRCPTGAIRDDGIAQGACIRCARCAGAGILFPPPPDASARRRAELFWPQGRPPPPPAGPGPLPAFGRSLHLLLADVGSCQACNLEVLALANPRYDAQRLGIFFTSSPRHADVLVLVGIPTDALLAPVRRAYEAMPGPKAVVAVGACAIDGGLFAGGAGTRAPLDGQIPVDLFVPGCPPTPIALLDALRRVTEPAPEAPP